MSRSPGWSGRGREIRGGVWGLLGVLVAGAGACASPQDGSGSGFSAGGNLSAGNSSATSGASSTSSGGGGGSEGESEGSGSTSGGSSGSTSGSDSASASGVATSEGTTGVDTTDGGTTGVECMQNGLGNLCGNPYDIGSVMAGATAMGPAVTVSSAAVSDWYKVSFPAVKRPGEGTPTLKFASNEGDVFRFDLTTTTPCMGQPVSCASGGDGGVAKGLKEWSFVDDQPMCCTPPDDGMVAWPGVLYVRVYRTDDACGGYQLMATR